MCPMVFQWYILLLCHQRRSVSSQTQIVEATTCARMAACRSPPYGNSSRPRSACDHQLYSAQWLLRLRQKINKNHQTKICRPLAKGSAPEEDVVHVGADFFAFGGGGGQRLYNWHLLLLLRCSETGSRARGLACSWVVLLRVAKQAFNGIFCQKTLPLACSSRDQ